MTETIDQIRARFQPRTRGGHQYEIFAERDTWLYGRVITGEGWLPRSWTATQGTSPDDSCYDLVPRSPHEKLLAEARTYSEGYGWHHKGLDTMIHRLIAALEESDK